MVFRLLQEADFLSRYNAALAAFEEVKGTLLNRDGVKVVDGTTARTDRATIRTTFSPTSSHGSREIALTFGTVWNGSLVSTHPTAIRVPLGTLLAVDFRFGPQAVPSKPAK